jgi:hypothetical protein
VKLLLNSAVIAAGAWGVYRYQPADATVLAAWCRCYGALPPEDPEALVSCIGYPETAQYVQDVCAAAGLAYRPPLSRASLALEVGDQALVVRLTYRVDPGRKGRHRPRPEEWELGLLTRTA